MQRFVCIHGHFYQPPREDPWTGRVGVEKSASPFQDWNERITAECYAPNADSLTGNPGSSQRVNNYSWMSFDFGPTLLRWLESEHPDVHRAIVQADRTSEDRFGGHGSAVAQVYNHMIMPLASAEDKEVQTRWGVEDFERRFHRYPEGMWLPETAVDTASLEALAEAEIKFTILAPHQALAVRAREEGDWVDVSGGKIDTSRAYLCRLPSGRSINLFFFDKGLSTNLSFGNLLNGGEALSDALLNRFSDQGETELVNIATDGETFGHHKKGGNQALAGCISKIGMGKVTSLANYGFYLSVVPPTEEVRIAEGTSWSCVHGVERWRSNCGCGSEIRAGYNQSWRGPLRSSMDWLGKKLNETYSKEGRVVFRDQVAARDHLPSVELWDKSGLEWYARGWLKPGQLVKKGAELLEMVQCSAAMFASCAWFWEDISRMETIQGLRFAARAMEIAHNLTGADLEPDFKRLLSPAIPNDQAFSSGSDLFDQLARPAVRS